MRVRFDTSLDGIASSSPKSDVVTINPHRFFDESPREQAWIMYHMHMHQMFDELEKAGVNLVYITPTQPDPDL